MSEREATWDSPKLLASLAVLVQELLPERYPFQRPPDGPWLAKFVVDGLGDVLPEGIEDFRGQLTAEGLGVIEVEVNCGYVFECVFSPNDPDVSEFDLLDHP